MRSPITALAGHLMWTRTGTPWAVWRITPLAYGFRPPKRKLEARRLHQALIRAMPGESLLLGVCASVDPAAVVERMIDDVDLAACPDWAAECEATLDTLDEIGVGERIYLLAVPLSDGGTRDRLSAVWKSALAELSDFAGLPRPGVPGAEIQRRQDHAAAIARRIPAPYRARPVTVAQLVWLQQHALQRGLFADLDFPEAGDLAEELLTPRTAAVLPEPMLDEGGQSDVDGNSSWGQRIAARNPLSARYLKVSQPHNPRSPGDSYQALLALSDVPTDGMVFPGSEFLGRVDECGLEVDWAMRLTVRASADVARQNKRALVNLNEQFDQRSGELSHGLNALEQAASDLAEYAAILENDKLEVETEPTVIFCTAAADPATAVDRAAALTDYFAEAGFKLAQPVGYQEDLWWAMLPGVPASRGVRDFAQITTARALSAAVPFASSDLGDRAGFLLGLNISTGRPGAVLHDIAGASKQGRDTSGSIGIAGEKGAGKSLTMKTIAGAVVDRGGRIIAVDRTPMGEWAEWATAVTQATIVDSAEPTQSLDPLRLFGAAAGAQMAQTFLTMLLKVDPTDALGVLLSEVLDPDYLAQHNLTALGQLPGHLTGACKLPGAEELGRLMNVFARKGLGRVVFDASLPVLDTSAPAIIIRTHGLALPSPSELQTPHLFEQMSLEKRMGRAIYALNGALARKICFTNRRQLAVYFLDECHHQTASSEGEEELVEFIRDDRKHKAAVVLGSHDPEADFGSETLRGLIPTRLLMRHTDETLARRGLKWLGMDPTDDDLVKILMEDTTPRGPDGVPEARRGEAFYRDTSSRIGRIKVLAPSVPARNAAVRTSPPELDEAGAA